MLNFEELLTHASMQIHEYAIHTQTSMAWFGREFPFYVMSYIQKGTATLRIRDEVYELTPHSVIIIPPHIPHDHFKTDGEPTVFLWWHFDYKVFDTLDIMRLLNFPTMFQLQENSVFEYAFSRYLDIMEQPFSMRNAMLQRAYAMEVMAHLLNAAQEESPYNQSTAVPEQFQEILSYILTATEPTLSLQLLSKQFNLHPTYISNRFQQYFGISPIALFRKLQLEKAKNLLSMKHLTVGEVAELLGYKDLSAFSRFFSSKMGYSPSQIHRVERLYRDDLE